MSFILTLIMGKKNKKKNIKKKEAVLVVQKPPSEQLKKKFRFNVTNIIAVLASLTVIILAVPSIRDMFLSPKQKWDKENTKQGDIKSPKISENYTPIKVVPNFNFDTTLKFPKIKGIYIKGLKEKTYLSIAIGNHIFECPVVSLYQGIEILNPIFRDCSKAILALAAKDDRLYVSTKFIALRDETEIGYMEFNHWTIYNDSFANYHPSDDKDDRFEVIDKQGNIVFSILYTPDKNQSFVAISGYFVSPKSVMILNNEKAFTIGHNLNIDEERGRECIQKSDSNWRANAEIEIAKIKSTFK